MAGKRKSVCGGCGREVWRDNLTILDLSGWSFETGDPVPIYDNDRRLSRIVCRDCRKRLVALFRAAGAEQTQEKK